MNTTQMPVIHPDRLDPKVVGMAKAICNKDRLRASKPPVDGTLERGMIAYVWRMVAFYISPKRQHQCMPVTADFDLPHRFFEDGGHDERRVMCDKLDVVVDMILEGVNPQEMHGLIRWGQAFGKLGSPQFDHDGSIIYR